MNPETPFDSIIKSLQERAKELDCLYRIDEVLKRTEAPLADALLSVVHTIPAGWQYSNLCQVRITYRDTVVQSPDFRETPWVQSANLVVDAERVGKIEIFYREMVTKGDEGPFLKEERKLINTIAQRIDQFIAHQRLESAFRNLETAKLALTPTSRGQWRMIADFLKRADPTLLARISRKMLNHLCRIGIPEAVELLHTSVYGQGAAPSDQLDPGPDNRPIDAKGAPPAPDITNQTFTIAASHLNEEEILTCVQKWIREERARFLANAVASPDSSLDEVADAIRRFHHIPKDEVEFSPAVAKGLRVSLIEHFFTDQVMFIESAKRFIDVDDYFDLVQRMIFPPKGRGKLGGKSSGLFLASRILNASKEKIPEVADIKVPKTWYITTDGILDFIQYNNLEEVHNQKYADIDQVRYEYPHIVQIFKNSHFSPVMLRGLSTVLDDLEGRPIIVRSSSLLEDRFGAAFSGKYKSLFLSNVGTKEERLAALCDAIAEVYASLFAPDPIEYRVERGLIDVFEEMGILIQEVVGSQVDKYFLPSFAGVAFSHNEFRWSSRIKREDGLIRIVPGLGTRAVDRLKDDYPALIAPGQPNLRVNVSVDEIVRYSPKKIDVVNLETRSFETIEIRDFLQVAGGSLPLMSSMISILDENRIRRPIGREPDVDPARVVFTFEGLISGTPFIAKIRAVLDVLMRELGTAVDIEFASDGQDLYLLQCRPQSHTDLGKASKIPRDIPKERMVFSAKRFVSNGSVPNITHIVYVDPDAYNDLPSLEEMRAVGRAVGKLNKVLPKRQFVLIGPGRWGSRGDIKLGVNVTYADISNTAVLIEVARKKGGYLPDLSFGTHFFQDLVESSIRYLPLYPDDEGIIFNEDFLRGSPNILEDILPEFADLGGVLRVIDVSRATGGMILRVLMNADLDEAVSYLTPPGAIVQDVAVEAGQEPPRSENHWRWRLHFAERIAANLDPDRFGVKAFYVFGSTKNGTAGPASDIDILIHFAGTEAQKDDLKRWLEGWSLSLAEINFLRTGYRDGGLLDIHLITDQDIERRTSFAVKIGAVTDPARELPMMNREQKV